ncbi:hypothetical protein X768_22545 [Mesorhizobium sp. LSJC265A00]|nr:hypothetical protein X768_22545 [Mesorhizobium sp. LSJC265A00]
MTRWRGRMGEERIAALLQESLSLAVKTGAMKPSDTHQVIVDTTVQPKNVMFPTDAKLIHRARERLVRLAKRTGLNLRQTYVRVGKLALIKHQRYAHAKQFKRANKALRRLGWTRSSNGRSTRPPPFSSSVSVSAAARSTACTRTRWNASARARRTCPTSSE